MLIEKTLSLIFRNSVFLSTFVDSDASHKLWKASDGQNQMYPLDEIFLIYL